MKKKILLGVVALGFLFTPLLYWTLGAQTNGTTLAVNYRYPVKYVCGIMGGGEGQPGDAVWPLASGRYHTAINVHNPLLTAKVTFAKKFVVTSWAITGNRTPAQTPGESSPFFKAELPGNQGFEIDCPEISQVTVPIGGCGGAGCYVKGFVVIMSPVELDVVAVYTVRRVGSQFPGVQSIHVEPVLPKVQRATIVAQPFNQG